MATAYEKERAKARLRNKLRKPTPAQKAKAKDTIRERMPSAQKANEAGKTLTGSLGLGYTLLTVFGGRKR